MSNIFVSYSRKNKPFVQRLVESLSSEGRDIWVDWEDIPWTADWWQEIREGIDRSDNFVFVLSPASLSSLVCNLEVAHAIDHHKRIIPIVLENSDPQQARETLETAELDEVALRLLDGRGLAEIARRNWQYLAQHNWMFFTDEKQFSSSLADLVTALDTDLAHVRSHTRLLVRAREWQEKQRDRSFLLDGTDMIDAETWLGQSGSKQPPPLQLHTEYIFESRRRANRRQRSLLAGVSAALVVTVVLAALALLLWRQASIERDRANLQAQISLSGRVALQGLLELDEQRLDRALLLGVEAVGIYDSREARSSLLTSLQSVPRLDKFLFAHQDWARSVVFSPDERQFASADAAGKIIFWDAASSQPLGEPLAAHEGGVWDIAYNPDGSSLASAGADGKLRLWDAAARALMGEFAGDDAGEVFSLAFSPDGALLASGHADNRARLWDVETRSQIAELENHSDWVSKVAFSPDGATLATGGRDALISLWTIAAPDEAELRATIREHTNWVFGLAFSPDGQTLASASADGSVRLWNAQSGEALGRPLTDHLGWVRTVAFSADGRLLASGGEDRTIILRDPASGRRLRDAPPLVGHGNTIFSIALSADGERMISVDEDGRVLTWNVWEQQPFSRVFAEQPGELYSLAYSADGSRLFSGSTEGASVLWDAASASAVFEPFTAEREIVAVLHRLEAHQGAVRQVAFSPDSSTLASVGDDGVAKLWSVASGELSAEFNPESPAPLWSVAFSPDGRLLAMGDESGAVALWNVSERSLRAVLPLLHSAGVTSLAFSPNGDTLASASRDRTIVLWDVARGAARGLPLRGHSNWVLDVAFSPDGHTLASASRDNTILLWDAATRQPVGQPFSAHSDWVWSVAFSPDGKRLASAGRDSAIRLWDVDLDLWIARACSVSNRTLDAVEQEVFLGEVSQPRPACSA